METAHIGHIGQGRLSDKTMPNVLPCFLPDIPKPFHNGLEAIMTLHRKGEVMVLVKDLKPFISSYFADSKEVWLGHNGFELTGSLITHETWRLACVFNNQHVDLASEFNWEVRERKRFANTEEVESSVVTVPAFESCCVILGIATLCALHLSRSSELLRAQQSTPGSTGQARLTYSLFLVVLNV